MPPAPTPHAASRMIWAPRWHASWAAPRHQRSPLSPRPPPLRYPLQPHPLLQPTLLQRRPAQQRPAHRQSAAAQGWQQRGLAMAATTARTRPQPRAQRATSSPAVHPLHPARPRQCLLHPQAAVAWLSHSRARPRQWGKQLVAGRKQLRRTGNSRARRRWRKERCAHGEAVTVAAGTRRARGRKRRRRGQKPGRAAPRHVMATWWTTLRPRQGISISRGAAAGARRCRQQRSRSHSSTTTKGTTRAAQATQRAA